MKKIEIKGLKEEVVYEKLDNGLEVFLWNTDKSNTFFASLNIKYGSIDTEFKLGKSKKDYKVPAGIAHFLEHVTFNTKEGNVFELFDDLGTDVNAFTTFEYTSYHITATKNLKENIDALLDFVCIPYLKKNMVAKEKGIIVEEARMGLDNPGSVMFFKTMENTLKNDKRREKVIGEVDDIKSIQLEDLNLVYDNFYHPQNMFLVVTGNIDILETIAVIKENMNNKTFKKYNNPQIKRSKEPIKVVKEYEEFYGATEIPKVNVNLKLDANKIGYDTKSNILLHIICQSNFGATSILKNELIESSIVTNLNVSRTLVNDNIIVSVDATTKYPEVFIEKVKDKLNNLTVTEEEFFRKVKASIANLVFMFDNPEQVNYSIQDDIIYSKDHKIVSDIKEIYENLTHDDVLNLLKKINCSNMSITVMLPKKNITNK